MENHVRIVGNLLFYLGITFGVLAAGILAGFGGYAGLLLTNDPFYSRNDLASIPVGRLLAAVYVTYSLLTAVPLIIAGLGIRKWKPWARPLGMIVSGAAMLHFPVGTGFGIYSLWVLNDESTEFLFANEPVNGSRR
ncbi:MAG TPA: hypothetical protein VFQ91_27105 [Bryobacteraceae bacterium]|nr:hypothetical protein [Bryobacteraceae bacterium]